MSRVVLAMSGGVDSSVAAWLLREQGHEVIGLFMRHGQPPPAPWPAPAGAPTRERPGRSNAADARRVADMLGIRFAAVDFEAEFRRIVDSFVEAYTSGRTPNPCVLCNRWVKFGRLLQYADGVGAQYVATGHHVRLQVVAGGPSGDDPSAGEIGLYRGRDSAKDQSYVLFGIERRVLPRLKLPVGEYRKPEIRRMAGRLGLAVAEKRDSQEICFVPDRDHAGFVRQHRGRQDTRGEIITTDGVVVGRHEGLEHFTVGQRKGLGIALGEPHYVVRIEPETRRVVIGRREQLARRELTAGEANWLVDVPGGPIRCGVKIRYRSRAAEATVTPLPGGRFHVLFDEPRYGVAPGQAAVCYRGDRVLGGGWIE